MDSISLLTFIRIAVLLSWELAERVRSLSTDQTKPARSSELAVSPTAALARQALLAGGAGARSAFTPWESLTL
jgi:hypothetical protein